MGLILKTTNGGAIWTLFNTQVNGPVTSIEFINANTGLAGTPNKVLKTTNAGNSWDTTINGGGKSISFINLNTGYSLRFISQPELWKTTNGGSTWDSISVIPVPIGSVNKIKFENEQSGFACGNFYTLSFQVYNSFIMKSTNSGMNWGNIYYGITTSFSTVYDVCYISNLVFAVGLEGSNKYLYKLTNNGINWNNIPISYSMNSLKFYNENTGWMCGQNGKILYTDNSGNNITEQISGTNVTLNNIFMVDNNTGYISGNTGTILKTTNGGVSAIQQTGTEIPDKYTLYQNYPNPFNPTTQISFDIPKSSFVKLNVFDALGRETDVLVNEELKPGSFKYDWNAASYPSGIYFYKLEAGSFSETKKMILIK